MIVPPGTLVAYRLSIDEVVDFSAGYDPLGGWTPLFAQWACEWKAIARLDGAVPPTWRIADDLISQGGAGCCSPQPVRAVVPTSSCSRPTSRRRTGLSRMTLRRVFRMIRVRGRNARTGQVPRPRAGA